MNLGPLELVPRWVFVLVIVALTVGFIVEDRRHNATRAELAEAKVAAAKLEADQKQALLEHEQQKAALVKAHGEKISQAEKTYAEKLAAVEVRARADTAAVGRLRNQLAEYARRGSTCRTTPVVSDGSVSAAEHLSYLLAESIDLLAEGRKLHAERDAEVRLLLDQIDADRAACSGKRVTKLASD